jgi:large conductance mechanosensitive channel
MINDFRAFLLKANAIALAIGVIVGAAVGGVVSALVADIIMPLVGTILPGGEWRDAKIPLGGDNAILYGHFLGTLVDFVIVMLVVYVLVRALIREAPPEPSKQCPECLEAVPLAARRCRACTATI